LSKRKYMQITSPGRSSFVVESVPSDAAQDDE
jgi:hypothetical protein